MKHFFTLIFILLALTSCSREPKDIKIGFNTWPGYEAIAIADQKDFFAKEGLSVDVTQYQSLPEVMQAFADKKIDVMFSTSNEVILLADKNEKIKMIFVTDYSNGTDTIVAKKSIHSIKELKGKKVGVVPGSISNYILLKALQKANLSEKDITIVNLQEKDAVREFTNNTVDAITTWIPYAEQAMKADGHIIFSTHDIPNQVADVMSIREDLLKKYPHADVKLVAAYLKTLQWLKQHPDEGKRIMARSAGLSEAELNEALSGLKLTGLDDNLAAFGEPLKLGTLYPATQTFINFLFAKKVIQKKLQAEKIIDPNPLWQYQYQYQYNDTTQTNKS